MTKLPDIPDDSDDVVTGTFEALATVNRIMAGRALKGNLVTLLELNAKALSLADDIVVRLRSFESDRDDYEW